MKSFKDENYVNLLQIIAFVTINEFLWVVIASQSVILIRGESLD